MGPRLAEVIERAGGRAKVAEATDIPQTSIDRYCRDESEIPAIRLGKIARVCETTTDYLIYGEDIGSDLMLGEVIGEPSSGRIVRIPMLNVTASAGPGLQNHNEEVMISLPFSDHLLRELGGSSRTCHFIQARGDSMEPTIADGAIVLVDASRKRIDSDGIYVLVFDDDQVRIKRVQVRARGVTLISDNPAYAPEELTMDEADRMKVAGQVFWSGSGI